MPKIFIIFGKTNNMPNYKQLEELYNLKQKGIITEEEYEREKAKVMAEAPRATNNLNEVNFGLPTHTYCLIMHLAQLVPGIGWVLSVVMWAINKDKDAIVDAHGKNIVNWIITSFIAMIVFAILIITIPLTIIIAICGFVFAIIGAIKANNRELWRYPMSYQFIK